MLNFVGRIIRMSEDKVPARLISAWCKKKRSLSRPITTLKHSNLDDGSKIVPTIDCDGSFDTWAHIYLDKLTRSVLINNLGHNHNYDYDKWDKDFRNNFSSSVPLIINPLIILYHLINHHTLILYLFL